MVTGSVRRAILDYRVEMSGWMTMFTLFPAQH